jgi:hypothetical protein
MHPFDEAMLPDIIRISKRGISKRGISKRDLYFRGFEKHLLEAPTDIPMRHY